MLENIEEEDLEDDIDDAPAHKKIPESRAKQLAGDQDLNASINDERKSHYDSRLSLAQVDNKLNRSVRVKMSKEKRKAYKEIQDREEALKKEMEKMKKE